MKIAFAWLLLALTGFGVSRAEDKPVSVLIVGGGSSHDFGKWFNLADVATLTEAKAKVTYTDKPGTVLEQLKDLDVLYLSTNQAMADAALRKGILDFAD